MQLKLKWETWMSVTSWTVTLLRSKFTNWHAWAMTSSGQMHRTWAPSTIIGRSTVKDHNENNNWLMSDLYYCPHRLKYTLYSNLNPSNEETHMTSTVLRMFSYTPWTPYTSLSLHSMFPILHKNKKQTNLIVPTSYCI